MSKLENPELTNTQPWLCNLTVLSLPVDRAHCHLIGLEKNMNFEMVLLSSVSGTLCFHTIVTGLLFVCPLHLCKHQSLHWSQLAWLPVRLFWSRKFPREKKKEKKGSRKGVKKKEKSKCKISVTLWWEQSEVDVQHTMWDIARCEQLQSWQNNCPRWKKGCPGYADTEIAVLLPMNLQ